MCFSIVPYCAYVVRNPICQNKYGGSQSGPPDAAKYHIPRVVDPKVNTAVAEQYGPEHDQQSEKPDFLSQ
jgi:hypothetical protein